MEYISPINGKKRLTNQAIPHLKLNHTKKIFHDKNLKHSLVKKGLFRKCVICNENCDWICEAPVCYVAYCLNLCFTKHLEIVELSSENNDCEKGMQTLIHFD